MIALHIICWISIYCLFHTCGIYPMLLNLLAGRKKENTVVYSINNDLPKISILLAVYNEERVIREKIESTFNTNYPEEKIEFLIGSDSSNDKTEEIISSYRKEYPQIQLRTFDSRTGKAGIINQLAEKANGEILILTDANVFFTENTIFELVKHFKNKEIGIVGGNIINKEIHKEGVSLQEKTYLSNENLMKYQEGLIWGKMIGAFGGVYSIRKDKFQPVPKKYIVDDFFLTFIVFEQGGKAINSLSSISFEDVGNESKEEFRRKFRISAGNYQNLFRFKKFLNPFTGLGFAFISHKVLRWLGPFFILLSLVISGILSLESTWYQPVFYGQVLLISVPLMDYFLKKIKLHIIGFRFISHFYMMNFALLMGFLKYLTGIKTNVWEPTKRFQ